jgi:NAD(P)H dehydrogenase (quinone)
MHVFIVFAHPSHQSLSHALMERFVKGLTEAGHTHEISDLFAMGFNPDLSEAEYLRSSGRGDRNGVPADVCAEQAKIVRADALVFFYPLWWSDAPAKLKGWFDRVYTQGFAFDYVDGVHVLPGNFKKIRKAIAVCAAGHTAEHLEETGIAGAMRKLVVQDRLNNVGVENAELRILGATYLPDLVSGYLESMETMGREFAQEVERLAAKV